MIINMDLGRANERSTAPNFYIKIFPQLIINFSMIFLFMGKSGHLMVWLVNRLLLVNIIREAVNVQIHVLFTKFKAQINI